MHISQASLQHDISAKQLDHNMADKQLLHELQLHNDVQQGRAPPVTASGTSATTGPAELLSKVRGLYGDRLQSMGREVRTLRDPKAERDETLLLGQLHELRSAA